MRRPHPDAALASFEPAHERTRAALERGLPISSVARFPGRDDLAPLSLLIESSEPSGFRERVRVEPLVDPDSDETLTPSMQFELFAGDTVLGTGTILFVPRRKATIPTVGEV